MWPGIQGGNLHTWHQIVEYVLSQLVASEILIIQTKKCDDSSCGADIIT